MTSQTPRIILSVVFLAQVVFSPLNSFGQSSFESLSIGQSLELSESFSSPSFRGIIFRSNDPLMMDFILDPGDAGSLSKQELSAEANKLIKYFLTALTIPERDIWVNLSPYEQNRIIPDGLDQTEMGRKLLEQDYLLKQLTASLMAPDTELGKNFWNRVYERSRDLYGAREISLDTYNKIWIVPDYAQIYEHQGVVYLTGRRMKVLLEKDFVALAKAQGLERFGAEGSQEVMGDEDHFKEEMIRNILIPEIEKEVNEGKTFAELRQIYDALILATWYKNRFKDGFVSSIYADHLKLAGLQTNDLSENREIWERYVQSFHRGVSDAIQEEYDPISQNVLPQKYFSGGFSLIGSNGGMLSRMQRNASSLWLNLRDVFDRNWIVRFNLKPVLRGVSKKLFLSKVSVIFVLSLFVLVSRVAAQPDSLSQRFIPDWKMIEKIEILIDSFNQTNQPFKTYRIDGYYQLRIIRLPNNEIRFDILPISKILRARKQNSEPDQDGKQLPDQQSRDFKAAILNEEENPVGGVNFNAKFLKVDLRSDQEGFPLLKDSLLKQSNRQIIGFSPEVVSIQAARDLLIFDGPNGKDVFGALRN